MAEWIKTQDSLYCLPKRDFSFKRTHSLKVKEWKDTLHVNGNQKEAGLTDITQ